MHGTNPPTNKKLMSPKPGLWRARGEQRWEEEGREKGGKEEDKNKKKRRRGFGSGAEGMGGRERGEGRGEGFAAFFCLWRSKLVPC